MSLWVCNQTNELKESWVTCTLTISYKVGIIYKMKLYLNQNFFIRYIYLPSKGLCPTLEKFFGKNSITSGYGFYLRKSWSCVPFIKVHSNNVLVSSAMDKNINIFRKQIENKKKMKRDYRSFKKPSFNFNQ